MMLVSLPMYALPGMEVYTENWWQCIKYCLEKQGLAHIPETISMAGKYPEFWLDDKLLLSQTCGYPYVKLLTDEVEILGIPHYTAMGCDGENYRSVIITNREIGDIDQLRGGVVAYNSLDSHSGYNALRMVIADYAAEGHFFLDRLQTGSHLETIKMVARKDADCGSIDCVTFALLTRHRSDLFNNIHAFMYTEQAPGLPYICAASLRENTKTAIRNALQEVFTAYEFENQRQPLLISGWTSHGEERYQQQLRMESYAFQRGYPSL